MTDPKIILTLPGYDVSTATPDQCSIHSDYDTMKISLVDTAPHFGTVRINFTGHGVTPNTSQRLLTIKHSYKYKPTWLFFYDIGQSYNADGTPPILSTIMGDEFDFDVFGDRYIKVGYDATSVFLDFVVASSYSPTVPASADYLDGKSLVFRYNIFANDGI